MTKPPKTSREESNTRTRRPASPFVHICLLNPNFRLVLCTRYATRSLHNIAITNIVWCMAYTGGGGSVGRRILRNSRATLLQKGSPPPPPPQVLERGGAELFFYVFGFITDAWTLRAASCVCPEWRRLLDRGSADGAAPIWAAATLAVPRGRGWAALGANRTLDTSNLGGN